MLRRTKPVAARTDWHCLGKSCVSNCPSDPAPMRRSAARAACYSIRIDCIREKPSEPELEVSGKLEGEAKNLNLNLNSATWTLRFNSIKLSEASKILNWVWHPFQVCWVYPKIENLRHLINPSAAARAQSAVIYTLIHCHSAQSRFLCSWLQKFCESCSCCLWIKSEVQVDSQISSPDKDQTQGSSQYNSRHLTTSWHKYKGKY